ncbi:MAG: hypothetical protein IJV39_05985 [Ruminococcus sp.]|nr:hypothetical protein [Ruminococcus sp.]
MIKNTGIAKPKLKNFTSDGDNLRKVLPIIFVFIFLLCGCSEIEQKNFTINTYFKSDVYISTGQIDFSGTISYSEDGKLTLTVNSPDEIKGYTYTVKDEKVTMDFQQIRTTYGIGDFPTSAPIAVISKLLKEISLSEPKVKEQDGSYTAKVNGYSVEFNADGYIENIRNGDLHITFVQKSS